MHTDALFGAAELYAPHPIDPECTHRPRICEHGLSYALSHGKSQQRCNTRKFIGARSSYDDVISAKQPNAELCSSVGTEQQNEEQKKDGSRFRKRSSSIPSILASMSSKESTTTSSDEETDDAAVVSKLVKDVTLIMTELHAEPLPDFEKMRPEFKELLQRETLSFQTACWNSLSAEQRHLAVVASSTNKKKNVLAENMLVDLINRTRKNIKERRKRLRSTIKECLDKIVVHAAPSDAIFLLSSFLDLRISKFQNDPPERKSLEVLSDKSEASAGDLGHKLTAEKIHHNMFASGDLREQQFIRFEFPEDFHQELPTDFDSVVKTLTIIQHFLSVAKPRAREPITQALFSLFMEELVSVLNATARLQDRFCHVITSVTEMQPVDVSVTISEHYMQQNAEMRELAGKPTTPNYQGGDWTTQMSVKSDLVVHPKTVEGGSGGAARRKQQQFIQCDLNIEMKRFRLLIGSENKSPLTQVAAESLARKSQLADPKCLYSVLTDCCGLYALCHVITQVGESDMYWISRQENEPRRLVAILRWLLLHSRKDDVPNLQDWMIVTAQDLDNSNETGEGGDEVSKTESRCAGERPKKYAKKNDRQGNPPGRSKPPKSNDGGIHVGFNLTDVLERDEDVSDGESSVDWSHFYALQTQRQTGPQFQFSGGCLPY